MSIVAAPASAGEAAAPSARDIQQYCANVAASAEALQIERRRRQLAELESEIAARLASLEARRQELRSLLDRIDAFERKTSDALVGLYSRMKPEAAAAQLTQIDDDVAAALILQLKAKISSAILGEMEASRGAALAKRIADLRGGADEKKP
ncbi:MotE family protein [Methylocystis sp. JAN1]|uniref:MotE family protein n=1 Tax=Methylocystis sp. JAN1 TaxID=3397211 RepID=UPI003FA1C3F6